MKLITVYIVQSDEPPILEWPGDYTIHGVSIDIDDIPSLVGKKKGGLLRAVKSILENISRGEHDRI